jgi:hypothetical protein
MGFGRSQGDKGRRKGIASFVSKHWETTLGRTLMRRVLTFCLAALLVISVAPLASGAGASQKESGTVPLAGPGPNGETTGGCWTGWGRRAWILSGGTQSSPFASMFEISKKTWNGKFKLAVTGGAAGTEDLDITFYAEPGQVDPTDPAMQAGILESGAYLTRKAGGEAGLVPPTSKVALVCLAIGSGANAEWSYTAKGPAKKKKK